MIIVITVDIRMFLECENNSGKYQNNAINDVKQISLSHVIKHQILALLSFLHCFEVFIFIRITLA